MCSRFLCTENKVNGAACNGADSQKNQYKMKQSFTIQNGVAKLTTSHHEYSIFSRTVDHVGLTQIDVRLNLKDYRVDQAMPVGDHAEFAERLGSLVEEIRQLLIEEIEQKSRRPEPTADGDE